MRTPVVLPALSLLLVATLHADAPRASASGAQTPPRQANLPAADATPPPSVPFRDGSKIAYIDLAQIAAQSAEGKAAGAKINTFRESRARELQSKQQSVEAKQQRLASSGTTLLSETARAALQAEIERDARDFDRMVQDADQDVQRLTDQLQQDFVGKIVKAVTRVATEKKIDIVFTDQSAMAFRAEDLNLSSDVIRALDAASAEPQPSSTPRP